MDRGGWWATVHRVAKSQTRLKRLSLWSTVPLVFWALLSEAESTVTARFPGKAEPVGGTFGGDSLAPDSGPLFVASVSFAGLPSGLGRGL